MATVSKTMSFETFVEKVAEKTIKEFEILLKEIEQKIGNNVSLNPSIKFITNNLN